ncbi:MAG: hypothetical protein ACREBG_08135 [Pyrinomonadaceae bacterium]
MNNFTDIVYQATVWLGAVLSVGLVVRIIYSFFRTKAKLQAEMRLEKEISLLAEQDTQVRNILAELESEIASKGVKPETYNKARDIVFRAARRLKADERAAVFEGAQPSVPHVSKIVKKSMGVGI